MEMTITEFLQKFVEYQEKQKQQKIAQEADEVQNCGDWQD